VEGPLFFLLSNTTHVPTSSITSTDWPLASGKNKTETHLTTTTHLAKNFAMIWQTMVLIGFSGAILAVTVSASSGSGMTRGISEGTRTPSEVEMANVLRRLHRHDARVLAEMPEVTIQLKFTIAHHGQEGRVPYAHIVAQIKELNNAFRGRTADEVGFPSGR
jgi:hypothetical protein